MMLTTKGRYAVMAMVDLAYYGESNKIIALHEIAERQEITINYLEQLFVKLKKRNLVESHKGPGGGYKLSKSPKDISVLEIINASEESIKMTRCKKNSGGCLAENNKVCFTHALWDGLDNTISNYLHSVSLQDIFNKINNKVIP
ncbi:MAG: RrF2 family transcriptional regulator [Rickettsiales bacterium]|jgi:Rrf2 family iron-sulfur cluster assembly transcriptional regulator|nr:RrF2 family transcriptional regulator [Rickettsiales bacterium]